MKEQSKKERIAKVDESRGLQKLLPKRKFRFGMILVGRDLYKSKVKSRSVMRRNMNEVVKEFNQCLINSNGMNSNARASPPHREGSTDIPNNIIV